MLGLKILEYNGEKYVLKRILKESSLVENYNAGDLKTFYFVETILRKDGMVYLCNKIDDAQII
tara:strand:+ start:1295 stop:1483 length:189 start_codon:yes stop_codon:yes gene_type:complete